MKLLAEGFWKTPVFGICVLWAGVCCWAGCGAVARQFAKTKMGKAAVFALSLLMCVSALILSTARPHEILRASAISDMQILIQQWQSGQREKVEKWLSNPPRFYNESL